MQRREVGFTLIELIIAIAVIGILMSIAYPSYTRYVQEARRTDAQAMLLDAAGKLERCYTSSNNYNYSRYEGNEKVECLNLTGIKSINNYYEFASESKINGSSFELVVVPVEDSPQEKDIACQKFTLSHAGKRGPDGKVDECW